jgi:hypothetical protein
MANPTTGTKNKDDLRNQGESMVDRAKDVASQVYDKTRDAAATVGEFAGKAASTAGHAADRAASAAGSGIKSLGETMREHTPHEGVLGAASQAVASGLTKGGKYLEQQGLSGMFDDLGQVIKNHPMPAVLVGIGIGFLLGRTLRS